MATDVLTTPLQPTQASNSSNRALHINLLTLLLLSSFLDCDSIFFLAFKKIFLPKL